MYGPGSPKNIDVSADLQNDRVQTSLDSESVPALTPELLLLSDVGTEFPSLTAEWAPQLTIRGFGGELETVFEEEYQENCRKCLHQARVSPNYGTGTTTDGQPPRCDETWALRHPEFGGYESAHIANAYFGGQMFGLHPSPYKHADHLFWLISSKSNRLPKRIHAYLLPGQAGWGVWLWDKYVPGGDSGGA